MEYVTTKLEAHDSRNGKKIEATLKGYTDIPFWEHDLKFEVILALLNTIDRKDFYERDQFELFDKYVSELQESIKWLTD